MNPPRLTGSVRLGIVFTVLWLIACPVAYLLAVQFHPNVLTSNLDRAFGWREGAESVFNGINFRELVPHASGTAVLALSLIPPLSLWGVFYILPKSIAWVIDGFKKQ